MLLRVQCGQPLQPPPLFAAQHSGFGSVGLRQKVAEKKMCDGCVRPCGGCWGSRPQLEQQQQEVEEEEVEEEEEEQQQQQEVEEEEEEQQQQQGGGERRILGRTRFAVYLPTNFTWFTTHFLRFATPLKQRTQPPQPPQRFNSPTISPFPSPWSTPN